MCFIISYDQEKPKCTRKAGCGVRGDGFFRGSKKEGGKMKKLTLSGLICCGGALLLLIFHSVAAVMKDNVEWNFFSINDIVANEYLGWISGLTWPPLRESLTYVITAPVFILLFVVGLIFFIINAFIRS